MRLAIVRLLRSVPSLPASTTTRGGGGGGGDVLDRAAVYVTPLSWITGRKELMDYFTQFGQVENVHLTFNHTTGVHGGYAVVQFAHANDAQRVIAIGKHAIDHVEATVRAHSVTVRRPLRGRGAG